MANPKPGGTIGSMSDSGLTLSARKVRSSLALAGTGIAKTTPSSEVVGARSGSIVKRGVSPGVADFNVQRRPDTRSRK